MKVGKEAQLAVRWANKEWTYYRVSKHRLFNSLVNHFSGLDNFRFGILYEFDSKTNLRGSQIGYFSKTENWLNT
jgi:hypothetical protein